MFRSLISLSQNVAAGFARSFARGIKQRVTDLRVGHVIELNGKMYSVTSLTRANTAQRSAFYQAELRDVKTGVKTKERFRSEESVEKLELRSSPYTFLFDQGDMCMFMHKDTYEQFELPRSLVGDRAEFLEDGLQVQINFNEDVPVGVSLPERMVCTVKETRPAEKSDHATSTGFKPAILHNGVKVHVPGFINEGDKVLIRTEDRTYVERA